MNSLASVLSWLADIVAIQLSHLLQALERLDLHSNLFTKTDYFVDHLTVAHVSEVVLLLLDEEVDTIEGYTTVVTHDTSTTVSIRKTGKNVVMANELHLWSISIEYAIIMSFAILVEDFVELLRWLIAICCTSLLRHLDTTVRHEGTLQRFISLKTYHFLQILGTLTNIGSTVSCQS